MGLTWSNSTPPPQAAENVLVCGADNEARATAMVALTKHLAEAGVTVFVFTDEPTRYLGLTPGPSDHNVRQHTKLDAEDRREILDATGSTAVVVDPVLRNGGDALRQLIHEDANVAVVVAVTGCPTRSRRAEYTRVWLDGSWLGNDDKGWFGSLW